MFMNSYSVVSNHYNLIDEINLKLKNAGFKQNNEKPEFVICVGGDGTFLLCERMFPSIPKIIIRYNSVCNLSSFDTIDEFILNFKNKNYKLIEFNKLVVKDDEDIHLFATSDVILRNSLPTHAIRFALSNNKNISKNFIGDGVLFSTKIGESGYYKSITKNKFRQDCFFGVALNNVTENIRELDFSGEDALWNFKLMRGKCNLVVDNNPLHLNLEEGKNIIIRKSSFKTKLLVKNN